MEKITIQNSFKEENGKLYLVATPIGNLEDMTFRAINILKEVDIIACEDTRVTRKLCQHFEIGTPLTQHHQYNLNETIDQLIQLLLNGQSIALVSDAGYPAISDPGEEIVKAAIQKEIDVVAIPGAIALIPALITSGIKTQPFLFFGFLDSQKNKRIEKLEQIKYYQETIILYEAPHRIDQTLNDLYSILGNRKIAIARELTKRYETVIRGNVNDIIEAKPLIKGEIVIVVEGYHQDNEQYETSIHEQINIYKDQGMSSNEAIKKVSKERKLSKNEVYRIYHKEYISKSLDFLKFDTIIRTNKQSDEKRVTIKVC